MGAKCVGLPLVSDPGERFVYGPNTAVLGDIIAKVSHMPLDAFLETKVFAPLGMRDTFFSVPQNKIDRVVTTHARTADGSLRETPNPDSLKDDPALALRLSTAADAGASPGVLNRGRVGSIRLVTERTIDRGLSNLSVRQVAGSRAPISNSRGGKTSLAIHGLFQIEGVPAGLRSAGSLSWGGFRLRISGSIERSLRRRVDATAAITTRALAVLRGFERDLRRCPSLFLLLQPRHRSAPISAYFALSPSKPSRGRLLRFRRCKSQSGSRALRRMK
jgi:hypothetical protein